LLLYALRLSEVAEMNEPVLAFLMDALPPAQRETLASAIRKRIKDHKTCVRTRRLCEGMDEWNTEEVVASIAHELGSEPVFSEWLKDCLPPLFRVALSNVGRGGRGRNAWRRLHGFGRIFGLEVPELELVRLMLCRAVSSGFGSMLDQTAPSVRPELVSAMTGVPSSRVGRALSRRGRLVTVGILGFGRHDDDSERFPSLDPDIRDYLVGADGDGLLEKHCRRVDGAAYAPASFGLPAPAVRIVTELVRSARPSQILLYGPPGAGKTEFAKSVVAACGKTARFVATQEDFQTRHRRLSVEATASAYTNPRDVIVVDEADGFLNTNYTFRIGERTSVTKGWLNEFLDRCRAKIIWITNDVESMEESTLRRFAFAVRFRRPTARQREQVWRHHLRTNPLRAGFDDDTIRTLAREYEVSAAGIGSALTIAPMVLSKKVREPEQVHETVRELLAAHERVSGQGHAGKAPPVPERYELGVLNTDVPIPELLSSLEGYMAQPPGRRRPPLNMLFWGIPGTGKTAFARYLAQTVEREILVRRASDLLSMWVGGTEHNIRDAFDEAEQEAAILLLDEADSFFIDRRTAHRSWEASQTNELLTQMENHHGVLICCTNLVDRLDAASLRRFAWKVKFLPLMAKARETLYKRYFTGVGDLMPGEWLQRLHAIPDLTAGDFRAVSERYRFRPASTPGHEELIRGLEEEVRLRKAAPTVAGFAG